MLQLSATTAAAATTAAHSGHHLLHIHAQIEVGSEHVRRFVFRSCVIFISLISRNKAKTDEEILQRIVCCEKCVTSADQQTPDFPKVCLSIFAAFRAGFSVYIFYIQHTFAAALHHVIRQIGHNTSLLSIPLSHGSCRWNVLEHICEWHTRRLLKSIQIKFAWHCAFDLYSFGSSMEYFRNLGWVRNTEKEKQISIFSSIVHHYGVHNELLFINCNTVSHSRVTTQDESAE